MIGKGPTSAAKGAAEMGHPTELAQVRIRRHRSGLTVGIKRAYGTRGIFD